MWLLKLLFSAILSVPKQACELGVRRHLIDGHVYVEETVGNYVYLRGRDGSLKPLIDQYGRHVRV